MRFANLAEGEHGFRIRRPGGRGGFAGGNMVMTFGGGDDEPGWESVVVAEGSEDTITLVRATMGSVEGRVTEVGAELVGASVRVAQAGRRGGGFDFGAAFGGGDAERTDSSGRYRLDDLEPGEYTLSISHPKRRMPAEYAVTIESGNNRKDVELPLSILQGRITDEAGKPLAGVEVTARKADSGGGPGRQRGRAIFNVTSTSFGGAAGGEITLDDGLGDSTHTDADGGYELRGVTPDVDLVVRATGENLQTGESRAVKVGENEVLKGIDLKLEAAGSVRVEALKADGSPAEFLMVRASFLDEVPKDSTSDGADAKDTFLQSGSTRLTGMRPGRWKVSVNQVGAGGRGEATEPQEVEVAFGVEPKLTFHLP
jgi:protocatechuate 3,4-dioxygenase beta subunit